MEMYTKWINVYGPWEVGAHFTACKHLPYSDSIRYTWQGHGVSLKAVICTDSVLKKTNIDFVPYSYTGWGEPYIYPFFKIKQTQSLNLRYINNQSVDYNETYSFYGANLPYVEQYTTVNNGDWPMDTVIDIIKGELIVRLGTGNLTIMPRNLISGSKTRYIPTLTGFYYQMSRTAGKHIAIKTSLGYQINSMFMIDDYGLSHVHDGGVYTIQNDNTSKEVGIFVLGGASFNEWVQHPAGSVCSNTGYHANDYGDIHTYNTWFDVEKYNLEIDMKPPIYSTPWILNSNYTTNELSCGDILDPLRCIFIKYYSFTSYGSESFKLVVNSTDYLSRIDAIILDSQGREIYNFSSYRDSGQEYIYRSYYIDKIFYIDSPGTYYVGINCGTGFRTTPLEFDFAINKWSKFSTAPSLPVPNFDSYRFVFPPDSIQYIESDTLILTFKVRASKLGKFSFETGHPNSTIISQSVIGLDYSFDVKYYPLQFGDKISPSVNTIFTTPKDIFVLETPYSFTFIEYPELMHTCSANSTLTLTFVVEASRYVEINRVTFNAGGGVIVSMTDNLDNTITYVVDYFIKEFGFLIDAISVGVTEMYSGAVIAIDGLHMDEYLEWVTYPSISQNTTDGTLGLVYRVTSPSMKEPGYNPNSLTTELVTFRPGILNANYTIVFAHNPASPSYLDTLDPNFVLDRFATLHDYYMITANYTFDYNTTFVPTFYLAGRPNTAIYCPSITVTGLLDNEPYGFNWVNYPQDLMVLELTTKTIVFQIYIANELTDTISFDPGNPCGSLVDITHIDNIYTITAQYSVLSTNYDLYPVVTIGTYEFAGEKIVLATQPAKIYDFAIKPIIVSSNFLVETVGMASINIPQGGTAVNIYYKGSLLYDTDNVTFTINGTSLNVFINNNSDPNDETWDQVITAIYPGFDTIPNDVGTLFIVYDHYNTSRAYNFYLYPNDGTTSVSFSGVTLDPVPLADQYTRIVGDVTTDVALTKYRLKFNGNTIKYYEGPVLQCSDMVLFFEIDHGIYNGTIICDIILTDEANNDYTYNTTFDIDVDYTSSRPTLCQSNAFNTVVTSPSSGWVKFEDVAFDFTHTYYLIQEITYSAIAWIDNDGVLNTFNKADNLLLWNSIFVVIDGCMTMNLSNPAVSRLGIERITPFTSKTIWLKSGLSARKTGIYTTLQTMFIDASAHTATLNFWIPDILYASREALMVLTGVSYKDDSLLINGKSLVYQTQIRSKALEVACSANFENIRASMASISAGIANHTIDILNAPAYDKWVSIFQQSSILQDFVTYTPVILQGSFEGYNIALTYMDDSSNGLNCDIPQGISVPKPYIMPDPDTNENNHCSIFAPFINQSEITKYSPTEITIELNGVSKTYDHITIPCTAVSLIPHSTSFKTRVYASIEQCTRNGIYPKSLLECDKASSIIVISGNIEYGVNVFCGIDESAVSDENYTIFVNCWEPGRILYRIFTLMYNDNSTDVIYSSNRVVRECIIDFV